MADLTLYDFAFRIGISAALGMFIGWSGVGPQGGGHKDLRPLLPDGMVSTSYSRPTSP